MPVATLPQDLFKTANDCPGVEMVPEEELLRHVATAPTPLTYSEWPLKLSPRPRRESLARFGSEAYLGSSEISK